MIMGCSGSGKSTLAKNLSKELGIDAMHLDFHSLAPGWTQAPRDQFLKALAEFLKKDKWIIDGDYRKSMIEERLEKVDTIIHLDFSTWNCFYGVIKRRIQYHGKTRPDVPENCPEQIDLEFWKWIWNFNRDQTPELKKLIAEQKDKRIIVLKNRWEIDAFMEEVRNSRKENRPLNWTKSN